MLWWVTLVLDLNKHRNTVNVDIRIHVCSL